MEFAELIHTPKLDGVILYSPLNEPVDGTLCITGHHLILSSRREGAQELWLLHQCIDHVERRPLHVNGTPQGGTLVLRCKDLRIISLQIAGAQEFANVARSVELLSNLRDVHSLYPFFYRPMYSILEDGYTAFGAEAEFAKLLLATDEWRLSHVNQSFGVCPTYGAALVVPRSVSDDDLRAAAAFREGGRFPVLSYRHENGCVLLRSSQPSGHSSAPKRSRADELLLNVHLVRSKKGFIVDTWGTGRGSGRPEADLHYPQWRKITRPITAHSIGGSSGGGGGSGGSSSGAGMPHIGATLDALGRLVDACNDTACTTDRWLAKLDASGWLTLVLNTLNTACVVAQCLDQEGSPVLVNGGLAGRDTPLLVTSLAQIILSPDCRTVRGLQALIEREWIQGGFPFTTRHRRSAYGSGGQQRDADADGSTFVLFLDCVHQLHRQFPCSFEFDVELLVVLFEHSFASQYGTFLADSERERAALRLQQRTTSLWSYLNRPSVLQTLLNPCYAPNQEVIWPSVAPISLELWSDLFLRWVIDQSRTKGTMKQIQALVTREKELRAEALRMRKELLDLAAKFDDTVLPVQMANCTLAQLNGGGVGQGQAAANGSGSGGGGGGGGGSGGGGGGAGSVVSVGGADSSGDGCSSSSGLGGSSSTIASSSSSAQQSARDGLLGVPGTGGGSEPSSRRSTAGEIDHPLQT